jgi:hypothetical protein
VIYTSGVWILGRTSNRTEEAPLNPIAASAFRPAHEQLVLDAATSTCARSSSGPASSTAAATG